jgi:Kelch motif
MAMQPKRGPGHRIRSFWNELPDALKTIATVVTALATLITAVAGFYGVVTGAFGPFPKPHPTPTPSVRPTPSSGSLTERLEAPLPEPRQELGSAALAGRLYVMGGIDAVGRDSASVFVYYEGAWHGGPPLPAPVDHPGAAVVGGRLFIGGGFVNGRASNAVYSLSGAVWQPVAPLNHARGALALVPVGDRLYAIGGNNDKGDNLAVAETYDPVANSWVDLPKTMPAPRNHVAGFAFQGKACVAGGRGPNTTRVDCYDPSTSTWSGLPDLPRSTSGAGAATIDDSALVVGGEVPPGLDGSEVIDQLAWFHQGSWELRRLSLARHGVQLGVLGSRAWACGGGTAPGRPHATTICTSIGTAG